jgi:AraC-like DNA-binding protein
MARGDFEGQVDLLDVLAHHFVLSQSGFLDRLLQDEETAADIGPLPSRRTKKHAVRRPSHPQVVKAVQYIKKNLSDPKLTVGRVARELEIHPHYLSHLFADQIGQRMSQFIADQRVEQAKTLLATTDWQIKRIAHETGHANPNWFCYIFRTLTGLTPGGYRAQSRGHGRAAASR